MKSFFTPHRIILLAIAAGIVAIIATTMRWDWLPNYYGDLLAGVWITLVMLVSTCILGMLLAVPLGLIQVTGPKLPALLCKGFCTIIRGTPLLLARIRLYTDDGLFMAAGEGYGAKAAISEARETLDRRIRDNKTYGQTKKHPDEAYWQKRFGWMLEE